MLEWNAIEITVPMREHGKSFVQRRRIQLTGKVDVLMREHKLSEPMVRCLAESFGGYPLASNENSYNALLRRGFFTRDLDQWTSPFIPTKLHDAVCHQMFRLKVNP